MIAHRAKPLLLALALGSFWIAGSARAELVRIYVTNSAGDSVHVVDPATNKVVQVWKRCTVSRSRRTARGFM